MAAHYATKVAAAIPPSVWDDLRERELALKEQKLKEQEQLLQKRAEELAEKEQKIAELQSRLQEQDQANRKKVVRVYKDSAFGYTYWSVAMTPKHTAEWVCEHIAEKLDVAKDSFSLFFCIGNEERMVDDNEHPLAIVEQWSDGSGKFVVKRKPLVRFYRWDDNAFWTLAVSNKTTADSVVQSLEDKLGVPRNTLALFEVEESPKRERQMPPDENILKTKNSWNKPKAMANQIKFMTKVKDKANMAAILSKLQDRPH